MPAGSKQALTSASGATGGYQTGARFGRMKHSAAIRPAEAVDFDALVALSERTIRARYPPFLGAKAVQDYLASGAVESFFQDSLKRCFIIEEEGVTAGVGAYKGVMVGSIPFQHVHHVA